MAPKDVTRKFRRGTLDNENMDKKESTASNFIPETLLDIICILERDEKYNTYKIIRNRNNFSLIAKFPAENAESTPLKNNTSVQQTASYQDKKQISSGDKLIAWKEKIFITYFWSKVCKSTKRLPMSG